MVAYYDVTNRRLKFAQKTADGWTNHVVQEKPLSDIGRYVKLLVGQDGHPVVAYLATEPGGTNGLARSIVRAAVATTVPPTGPESWRTFDLEFEDRTPCRAYHCSSGLLCRADIGVCANEASGCDPSCGSGEKCFDDGKGAACQAVYDAKHIDAYPEASGLYISLANAGNEFAMTYYDRIHGNLMGIGTSGGAWGNAFIIDGQDNSSSPAKDTGDMGIGSSLFVDGSGVWHVSYVSGLDESVRYARVENGKTAFTSVADDGSSMDGQAIIGDDSDIAVVNGKVLIAYQDATNGKLRLAEGTDNGSGNLNWALKTLDARGFAGAFNHLVETSSGLRVATWWREGNPKSVAGVQLLAP